MQMAEAGKLAEPFRIFQAAQFSYTPVKNLFSRQNLRLSHKDDSSEKRVDPLVNSGPDPGFLFQCLTHQFAVGRICHICLGREVRCTAKHRFVLRRHNHAVLSLFSDAAVRIQLFFCRAQNLFRNSHPFSPPSGIFLIRSSVRASHLFVQHDLCLVLADE